MEVVEDLTCRLLPLWGEGQCRVSAEWVWGGFKDSVAHERVVGLEEGDFQVVDLCDFASNVLVPGARRDVDACFDPAAAAFAAAGALAGATLAGAALAGAVALETRTRRPL